MIEPPKTPVTLDQHRISESNWHMIPLRIIPLALYYVKFLKGEPRVIQFFEETSIESNFAYLSFPRKRESTIFRIGNGFPFLRG